MRVARCLRVSLILLFFSSALFAQLPEDFAKFKVAKGLNPVTITDSPDGRIFLVEKDGNVLIIENDKVLPQPLVKVRVNVGAEKGLLGIALHPNFLENKWFYLFYNPAGTLLSRLSKFTEGPNVNASEEILFEIPDVGYSHIGGAIHFGQDEKLYVAIGDNYDLETSQMLDNPFGKILRLNDDGSIPEDNPYYLENTGLNRAIWVYGLRNPFTFAVDKFSDKIFINDVGAGSWEEINVMEKGVNFGWSTYEGFSNGEVSLPDYRDPLYSYSHDEGCSIVGGDFYPLEGGNFPNEFQGKYFFVDYCGGFIRVIDPNTGDLITTFDNSITRPLSVLFTKEGNLYYLERGEGAGDGSGEDVTASLDGALWKVIYNPEGFPIISEQPENKFVPVGENVEISVIVMGKDPLEYTWFKNNEQISISSSGILELENVQLSDSNSVFNCVIANEVGTVYSDSVTLRVTENTRPAATIISSGQDTYGGGDTFQFSGTAEDKEDGEIPDQSFFWWVDFHHNEHTHPAMERTSGRSINFRVTPKGEVSDNVWYRIYLQVVDSEGLSNTSYTEIFPRKHTITVDSRPSGLEIQVENQLVKTPYYMSSVEGIIRTFTVETRQQLAENEFRFVKWADDMEERQIKIATPASDTTIVAEFFTFGIYPNPINDRLTLSFDFGESVDFPVTITNLKGEIVYQKILSYSPDQKTYEIELGFLSKGMYILVVDKPGGKETFSILKND